MIANLGIWLELINHDSTWFNGFSWMKNYRCFPATTIDEIRLNKEKIVAIQKENLLKYSSEVQEDEHQTSYLMTKVENGTYLTTQIENELSYYRKVPQEVEKCYNFPNSHKS